MFGRWSRVDLHWTLVLVFALAVFLVRFDASAAAAYGGEDSRPVGAATLAPLLVGARSTPVTYMTAPSLSSIVSKTTSFPVSLSSSPTTPSPTIEAEFADGATGSWTPWSECSTSGATFTGVPGHTYFFRARAVVGTDSVGQWSSPAVTTIPYDESVVRYSTGWSFVQQPSAFQGTIHSSVRLGATATYTFNGTRIALVATKGPGRGRFTVYLDGGSRPVATVDTGASSVRYCQTVFDTKVPSGRHTLTLRNCATPGRPRIELDAVAEPKTENAVWYNYFAGWNDGRSRVSSARDMPVMLPRGYDPDTVYPWILMINGSGRSGADFTYPGNVGNRVANWFVERGYVVVGATTGGLNNWGNDVALRSVELSYAKARAEYRLSDTPGLAGFSMGGATALLMLKARPTWWSQVFLLNPVSDLDAMHTPYWGNSDYSVDIERAYACDRSTYETATTGHAPEDFYADYAAIGVPIQVWHGTGDTIVAPWQSAMLRDGVNTLNPGLVRLILVDGSLHGGKAIYTCFASSARVCSQFDPAQCATQTPVARPPLNTSQ